MIMTSLSSTQVKKELRFLLKKLVNQILVVAFWYECILFFIFKVTAARKICTLDLLNVLERLD